MQGNSDLGIKAGIGHQQGAIGTEALPSRGLANRLEEERGERLAADSLASGVSKGILQRGLHELPVNRMGGRHGVDQNDGPG